MNHLDLIRLGQALGYNNISDEGLCQGFSMMWIQAVCIDEAEVEHLNQRMQLLADYAATPAKLSQELAEARTSVKEGKQLTDKQKWILELPAFFEGICLYLYPNQYKEIWDNKDIHQHHEIDIAFYTQTQKLENQGGLSKPFTTTDYYDQQGLVAFLNKLSDTLQDRKDVGITLGANKHTVTLRVLGNNKFQLVDTNDLYSVQKTEGFRQICVTIDSSVS